MCFLFISTFAAQTGASSCGSPELMNGYYVPEGESYDRGAQIFYTCEKGHKPAAEGWWATTLCRDGTWFPKPQCISTCFILAIYYNKMFSFNTGTSSTSLTAGKRFPFFSKTFCDVTVATLRQARLTLAVLVCFRVSLNDNNHQRRYQIAIFIIRSTDKSF